MTVVPGHLTVRKQARDPLGYSVTGSTAFPLAVEIKPGQAYEWMRLQDRVIATAEAIKTKEIRQIAGRGQSAHWASLGAATGSDVPRGVMMSAVYDALLAAAEFLELRARQPRKPNDWGALRTWAWGTSRALDCFETDKAVDVKRVGIKGLSRYGKAAIVTMCPFRYELPELCPRRRPRVFGRHCRACRRGRHNVVSDHVSGDPLAFHWSRLNLPCRTGSRRGSPDQCGPSPPAATKPTAHRSSRSVLFAAALARRVRTGDNQPMPLDVRGSVVRAR